MQASKLQTWWIMLKSAWIMIYICSLAIWKSLRGKITRPWIDEYTRIMSTRILEAAKVSFVIHNPNQFNFKEHERYIVMCNHTSLYDIPLSFIALPGSIRMLAKKELLRVPFLGQALRAAGFPTINRHDRTQAIQDLQQVKKLMEEGIIIWVAPEGTRSRDGKLAKFKKGGFITALQAQAIILPIVIRGADKILPAKTWRFHLNQTADIFIGNPIDTRQYTLDDRAKLMERVYSEMQNLL